MKEKLRGIYAELRGYLSQAPVEGYVIFQRSMWEEINKIVDKVESVTGEDHNRFKMKELETADSGAQCMDSLAYRAKLAGLISRLHDEYFSDEPSPLAGTPNTLMMQQQSQNQSTLIQILVDIQRKIDEKLKAYPDESGERTFLEKVKASLSKVSNVTELPIVILKTAKEVGLTIEQLSKLFS